MSDIWKKAPETATHYTPKLDDSGLWCDVFWRLVDGASVEAWRVEDSGELTHVSAPYCTVESKARMIARTQSWSGEGSPPVGTVCEFKEQSGDSWAKCTIIGEFQGRIICGCNQTGAVGYIDHDELRPIRTPEQIAAEERLAAINYMEIDAGMCATAFDGDPEARVWIENLIDKGWRKAKTQ